jgi:hypothetical protein
MSIPRGTQETSPSSQTHPSRRRRTLRVLAGRCAPAPAKRARPGPPIARRGQAAIIGGLRLNVCNEAFGTPTPPAAGQSGAAHPLSVHATRARHKGGPDVPNGPFGTLTDAVDLVRTTVPAAGWVVDVARVLLGTLNVLIVPFATCDTGLTCTSACRKGALQDAQRPMGRP